VCVGVCICERIRTDLTNPNWFEFIHKFEDSIRANSNRFGFGSDSGLEWIRSSNRFVRSAFYESCRIGTDSNSIHRQDDAFRIGKDGRCNVGGMGRQDLI